VNFGSKKRRKQWNKKFLAGSFLVEGFNRPLPGFGCGGFAKMAVFFKSPLKRLKAGSFGDEKKP
jgi:hypothetical protein